MSEGAFQHSSAKLSCPNMVNTTNDGICAAGSDMACAARILRGKERSSALPHERDSPLPDEILERRLEMLRVEHRDLDSAIAALVEAPVPDQLQIARFKKRKLALRDEIAWIEARLIPDIIA